MITIINVYMIRNKINNKVYIGISQEVNIRLYRHKWLLENNKHPNIKLQNAWNKYGNINFEFTTIATLLSNERDKALDAEAYLINYYDSYHTGYNMSQGYDGSTKIIITEERKLKLSKASKGNQHRKGYKDSEWHKQRISETHKGKILSDETKHKISQSKKGKFTGEDNHFYGKHHTEETKDKIREKLGKRVKCIETSHIYNSSVECAKLNNIDRSNLSTCCRKNSLLDIPKYKCKGFTYIYVI